MKQLKYHLPDRVWQCPWSLFEDDGESVLDLECLLPMGHPTSHNDGDCFHRVAWWWRWLLPLLWMQAALKINVVVIDSRVYGWITDDGRLISESPRGHVQEGWWRGLPRRYRLWLFLHVNGREWRAATSIERGWYLVKRWSSILVPYRPHVLRRVVFGPPVRRVRRIVQAEAAR